MRNFLVSTLIITGFGFSTVTSPALADHKHQQQYKNQQQIGFARVTDVEPIYQTVTHRTPERSCWNETRYHTEQKGYRSNTPTILGTLIGGAIGNEVGHSKTNKKVGTVVGAVLGASLANDWRSSQRYGGGHSYPVTEEVCEINERIEHEQQVVGYNVSYNYQGQNYHTRMDHHPGKKLKVAVHVTPLL